MPDTLKHKAPLAALCVWCVALLVVRSLYAGRVQFAFLVWNLFLAAIPVVMALVFAALARRKAFPALQVGAFAVWLAFLPNAPYLVTDFIHLSSRPPVPLWFDVALISSFAATGVLLGYSSVADVEAVVAERFGRRVGTAVALGSLGLCGFGIYLGRFLRWNSWDLVTSPATLAREVLGQLLNPLAYPRGLVVSLIYGLALMLGYVALHGFARSLPRPHPQQ